MLKVKNTKKMGRGIFTSKSLKKNSAILENYLIVSKHLGFDDYVFEFSKKESAISLGLASLINHSENPNVRAEIDHKSKILYIVAIRDIEKNEQLFLNYGYKI